MLIGSIALLFLAAKYGLSSGIPKSDQPTYKLPLRIHLIQSKARFFQADITEGEVKQLVAGANEVWKQADISWEIESIIAVPSGDIEELVAFFQNPTDLQKGRRLLLESIPEINRLKKGWNLYFVNQLGPSGGVYLREIGSVVFPVNAEIGRHSQILAHELGHALGLRHQVPDGKNVMQGKPRTDSEKELRDPAKATYLSPSQIAKARNQAKQGIPAGQY